jgi:hypothetical protein
MIHGWTLMRIEWLRRRLREADPAGAAAEDMEELSRALADSGSAAGPLLADPRVGRWCAVVSNLLDRDAARLLPDGHFSAACREAQALTLAARLLLAQAGPAADMPPMPVRCDRAGEIRLLGTRLVLRCGLASAGSQITVGILRGQPAAPGVPDAELAVEPTPLSGLVVPDGDPVAVATCGSDPVLSAPWPMIAVERGERPPHAAARPGIAEVPVTASPAWRAAHVAAAAAHLRSVALGEVSPADWADGLPPDIADVADAGHVSRLLELFERSAVQGSAAQSKERDEIADILGRMAGWLGGAGRLSDQGALIRDRLADHGFRPGRRVRASQRNTTTSIVWRTQWQSAGGRFREPLPGAGRRALPGADLSGLLKQLGSPDDVPVNTLADEQARADPTIDHLSLMHAREPERFAELAGQIERLPLPLSVAGQLLTGHVAYIRERFDLAVAAYAELLGQLPEDIDLWRDFAFALRHLGEVRLNEVAIFRLKDVVERASACHLELGSLDGVRAEPDGWQSAAIPVRLHVGLLEWVGHDPDYR